METYRAICPGHVPMWCFQAMLLILLYFVSVKVHAQSGQENVVEPEHSDSAAQVIRAFTANQDVESDIVRIEERKKQQIMFFMGVPLLVFIFITAGLGIAMGIYGKDVYLPHMIFAGLSLTLALAHAIVGVVWFYPF